MLRGFSALAVVCAFAACGGGDDGAPAPDGTDPGHFGVDASATDGSPASGDAPAPGADGAPSNGDASAPPPGTDGGVGTQSLTDFPSGATIYADISNAPVDAAWNTILTNALAGGWGNNFQLDPSFTVNYAGPTVARRTFTQPAGALPDCDTSPIPVPAGGKIEGAKDYFCAAGGDCHLLVFQGTRLYELYQASITGGQATGGTFTGSCLVVWDLTRDYWTPGSPFSRGDGCNGSDAADMPIATLVLKKAEILAHAIKHAMRFTIGNAMIDNTNYVHPATHLGGSGPSGKTLPYGARLRLKKTFDVASLATPEAQAIAVALQKYGMFMDDGGGFYVSATTDITDVIDPHSLSALKPTDFEMVDGGTRVNFHQQNCTRSPITN